MTPRDPGDYVVRVTGSTAGPSPVEVASDPVVLRVREGAALNQNEYSRREGFRLIYEFQHWSEEGGGSGHGSSLAGSASDRSFLLDFLERFQVTSLFDAGCGAMVN